MDRLVASPLSRGLGVARLSGWRSSDAIVAVHSIYTKCPSRCKRAPPSALISAPLGMWLTTRAIRSGAGSEDTTRCVGARERAGRPPPRARARRRWGRGRATRTSPPPCRLRRRQNFPGQHSRRSARRPARRTTSASRRGPSPESHGHFRRDGGGTAGPQPGRQRRPSPFPPYSCGTCRGVSARSGRR